MRLHRRDSHFRHIVAGGGKVWMIWQHNSGELTASRYTDGSYGPCQRIGFTAPQGFSTCVASDGVPWVVWQQIGPGHVWACQGANDTWDKPLQVSAQPARGLSALRLVPDAYGNVWIFWETNDPDEIRVCRMGARSGQETVVVQAEEAILLDAATHEGALHVVYEDSGLHVHVAVGTEHTGFHETIDLPPG